MKKNILGLAVATALSMTAFSAMADDMYRGSWYAVPGASYMNTDSDLDADNGAGGFLAIGKELSPSWDLQGRLGYNRADEDLGLNFGESGKYKSTQLGLDALYMFSRSNFRPFLLAGLGATRNNIDYKIPGLDVDGKKTSWLGSLGLGAQYLFNDTFGLQADLRHQWSKARVKVTDPATGARISDLSDSDTIGNTLFNIGGVFRFGAPAPVVAEAAPEPAPVAAAPEPAPEPAPAPAPEPVKCESRIDTITIDAAKLFGFDKANLLAEGKAELDQAADKIKANPKITNVIVTGHTDRLGSFDYNQKLSERRAKQVAEYLASKGVDQSIIASTGRGESVPVIECNNKNRKELIKCLAPNRRVTVEAKVKEETGCN